MRSLTEVAIKSRPIGPIGKQSFKTNCNQLENKELKLTKQEVLGCDIGLSEFQDLIPHNFYKWHCKVWYQIGRDKYSLLAAQARADGKNPAKLFSYLLNKELKKH